MHCYPSGIIPFHWLFVDEDYEQLLPNKCILALVGISIIQIISKIILVGIIYYF